MDGAKVIIIEDQAALRRACKANLEVRGHEVVAMADSVGTAYKLINHLVANVVKVDIAIVDGNLGSGAKSGQDGAVVAADIHERLPGVTVIGWSLGGSVDGADMNAPKHDALALDTMIKELPNRS